MKSITLVHLFMIFFISTKQQEEIPPDCRLSREDTLRCAESVPDTIPKGIVEVFVSNYLQTDISNITFTHLNWRNVKVLDININSVVDFTLADFNFYTLNHIKVLGVHSPRLKYIPEDLLKGLYSLRTLDFSKCSSLPISEFTDALLAYPRELEYLKMDQVGIRKIILDGHFINMTALKRISKLSLSGTNIFPTGPIDFTGKVATLKYLDISNSTILPSRSYSSDDRITLLTKVLRNVEVFNFSSMPFSFINFDFTILQKLNGKDCHSIFGDTDESTALNTMFPNLKVLELNNLFKFAVILKDSVVNLTCIRQLNMRTISMKKNNLQWVNISLLLSPDFFIKEFDMSSNKLQYLSPKLTNAFVHLQNFNLANNSLGFMERYEEFSDIFAEQRHLIDLNLAYNGLTNLPANIFKNNDKLRHLDLQGNNLHTVSFKFNHLRDLITLNMSFNNFVSIDTTTVKSLSNFLNDVARNWNRTVYIELIENPFNCNCETVEFLEWITGDLTVKYGRSYRCLYEGDIVTIDNNIIEKSKFLCIRTTVIVISVMLSLITATIPCILIVVIYYRSKAKKKRLTRDNFIETFKANGINKKRVSFVAYASDDMDILSESFCRRLDGSLQEAFRTKERLFSTGDLDIAPGYPIIDEVIKCVSEACTMVALSSRKFCESEWCQIELREAYSQNIPIILVFKEDVAEELMSPTMLTIFRKFTRAKLIVKDDTFEMIPEWKLFVESVINLASGCNYDVQ